MFAVRLTSVFLSLLVSINAWSLDLRIGDVYRGKIHLGKHPGQACYVKVHKEILNGSDRVFQLAVFKKSIAVGRNFNARAYELNNNMTAQGSVYYTKKANGTFALVKNPKETLNIELANGTIKRTQIYNGQSPVLNCVDMSRIKI